MREDSRVYPTRGAVRTSGASLTSMSMKRDSDDPLVQFNVLVPKSVRDAIDDRAHDRRLSRNEWSRRVFARALSVVGTSQLDPPAQEIGESATT